MSKYYCGVCSSKDNVVFLEEIEIPIQDKIIVQEYLPESKMNVLASISGRGRTMKTLKCPTCGNVSN